MDWCWQSKIERKWKEIEEREINESLEIEVGVRNKFIIGYKSWYNKEESIYVGLTK